MKNIFSRTAGFDLAIFKFDDRMIFRVIGPCLIEFPQVVYRFVLVVMGVSINTNVVAFHCPGNAVDGGCFLKRHEIR